jgi:competence protein ComEA
MIAFVKRYAGFFFLLLSLGGLVLLNLGDPVSAAVDTTTTASTTTSVDTSVAVMTVEILGQVAVPGRYVLAGDVTIADLLRLAGGILPTADLTSVNVEKALYDGMVVSIPALTSTTVATSYVYVDIKGAVRYPGVYRVAGTLRVQDVVALAGGLLATADTSSVNLASPITDAMMIVIPTVSTVVVETSSDDESDDRIDINTATVEELDTLYGIGYILAQRIIDYRADHGDFAAIEEIMNVDGIGTSVYEAIKDDIRV